MKDPFAPYIHLFLLFESLSFLLIQGSARILAGGLTQRKEATFCQQRGYFLVYGPATLPIPQIASPASFFFFFHIFIYLPIFFISHFTFLLFAPSGMRARAIQWKVSLPLEPPPFTFLSLLSLALSPSFYHPLSFFSH